MLVLYTGLLTEQQVILLRSVERKRLLLILPHLISQHLRIQQQKETKAYTISLRTGSILGAVVDTLDITVIDTSLNAPTYNLTGPAYHR